MYKKTIFTALMALALPFFAIAQEAPTPTIAIAVDKMNVIYAGLDNPLTIAINGHPFEDLDISSDKLNLVALDKFGRFNARINGAALGEAYINIHSKKTGKQLGSFRFRLKRIPDPVAQIGGKTGGVFSSGGMQAQQGIIAMIEGFDISAQCQITSFTCYYSPVRAQVETYQQSGGRFTSLTLAAIKKAKPGDMYQFVDIKAFCPGDPIARSINSIAIQIK